MVIAKNLPKHDACFKLLDISIWYHKQPSTAGVKMRFVVYCQPWVYTHAERLTHDFLIFGLCFSVSKSSLIKTWFFIHHIVDEFKFLSL